MDFFVSDKKKISFFKKKNCVIINIKKNYNKIYFNFSENLFLEFSKKKLNFIKNIEGIVKNNYILSSQSLYKIYYFFYLNFF